MVNGTNALHTTGPWKVHIAGLRERADQLQDADVKSIFRNPRVCYKCRESRTDLLIDCVCACVSYCIRQCSKPDKQHAEDCDRLRDIALHYSLWFGENIGTETEADLRESTVCKQFKPVTEYMYVMPLIWGVFVRTCELLHKENASGLNVQYYMTLERLSIPITLLYALQSLPNFRLSTDHRPQRLENLTTLTVHIVNSSPLFDSEPWEIFMHRLPKLKQLNVVFIVQGKPLKQSFFSHNAQLSIYRCKDCKDQDRIITYSVQPMYYHMFFSTQEYTEPDAVFVYGNAGEMCPNDGNDIHSSISYRNMIYNPSTVLVLVDETKDLVEKGARAVNDARSVVELVSPRINPFQGVSTNRADIDSSDAILDENCYFTCLRRK